MINAHEFLSGPFIDLGDDYQFKLMVDINRNMSGETQKLVQLDSRHFPVGEIATIQTRSGLHVREQAHVKIVLRSIWDFDFEVTRSFYINTIQPHVFIR
jgi:hypothetical protein